MTSELEERIANLKALASERSELIEYLNQKIVRANAENDRLHQDLWLARKLYWDGKK